MRKRFARYIPAQKSSFYKELNNEVIVFLQSRKSDGKASARMILKILFCVCLFIFFYIQYISVPPNYGSWLLGCLGLGFSSMLIGVNIGHDAVHGALFRKKWLNKATSYSFDLIGISSYLWYLKHNVLHHKYPNVTGIDLDIEASPFLRLSPSDPLCKWQRYQYLYAPFIYMLFSLNLLFFNDYVLLKKLKREDIDGKPHPAGTVISIIIWKLFYLFYMLVVPMWLLPFSWWQVLCGFLLMHVALSIMLALVLLPSHLFEQSCFSNKDSNGFICEDWAVHQVVTTLDFASGSSMANFLFGGFNTNVVHHLFPRICHCYYRPLTKIVVKKAREYKIPYNHSSFFGAVKSHFQLLKKLGHR
jgi:linoleoyl-CoA desaturase